MNEEFYTLTNYMNNNNFISLAMEDYIEMIYRKNLINENITITSLSNLLHIKKSSCSKMIAKLKDLDLVYIENGYIYLSKVGLKLGRYLYKRHNIIEIFLKKLNKEYFKLEQVEKIEHFIDEVTLRNLEEMNKFMN